MKPQTGSTLPGNHHFFLNPIFFKEHIDITKHTKHLHLKDMNGHMHDILDNSSVVFDMDADPPYLWT